MKGDPCTEGLKPLGELVMQGMVHPQDCTNDNGKWEPKELELTSQPQYKIGNVIFHYYIKLYMIHFTTKISLYIPTIAFSIELHPKRDHTKHT